MSKKKLKEIMLYIETNGVCTESELWKNFVHTDDILDRHEISASLYRLQNNGSIDIEPFKNGNMVIWKQRMLM